MYTLNIPLDDLSDEMVINLAIHLGFKDRPVFNNDDLLKLLCNNMMCNRSIELSNKIMKIAEERRIEYEKEYDNYTADAIEWLVANYGKREE